MESLVFSFIKKKGASMLNFKNAEKKNKNYMYQNLQKSKSFNSNYSSSNFDYACFRGAHLKSCQFNACHFTGAEFIGANLKGSQFKEAEFMNTVFEGTKLEGTDFKGALFDHTYFVSCNVESAINLDLEDSGIKVFSEMPELNLNPLLFAEIEKLMENQYVKKARVLDTKDKKMNTISVMILLDCFSEEELIQTLPKMNALFDRDFYTLSYIIKMIRANL